jgi:voltage-gated potassium channel
MSDPPSQTVRHGPLARLRGAGAYDRFVRWTELPMLALSVVFLAVLVTPVLATDLSPGWRHALALADVTIWVAFAADYLIRLLLAPARLHFVIHNIPDLVVVTVPVLRPLRLARLARFARVGALAAGATRRSQSQLHIDVAIQVVATAMIIVFVGAVGILDVERHAKGANIRSFGDALWWALTTVTTVGYGDKYPVTTQGRLIAALVMLTGIAVLGVVTASVATWFIQSIRAIERQEAAQTRREVRLEAALSEALQRLARIEARFGPDAGDNEPPAQVSD